jgi:hypothetical protein
MSAARRNQPDDSSFTPRIRQLQRQLYEQRAATGTWRACAPPKEGGQPQARECWSHADILREICKGDEESSRAGSAGATSLRRAAG